MLHICARTGKHLFYTQPTWGVEPLPATKMIFGYRLATSAEPMGPGRLEGYWAQCSICVAIPDTSEI